MLRKVFNERVHPFEKIRAIHRAEKIPRSPLGKLLRAELAQKIAAERLKEGSEG